MISPKRLALLCLFIISSILAFSQPSVDWVSIDAGEQIDCAFMGKLDDEGNAYSTGYFQSTIQFHANNDPVESSASGGTDIYIQKTNPDGTLAWVKTIGGTGNDAGKDLALDGEGNIYILGDIEDTVDMDPGEGIFNLTANVADSFILKLDSNGDFVWVKQFIGSSGSNNLRQLELDNDGNILLAGGYSGTIDFNPGEAESVFTSTTLTACCVKLDSSGEYLWSDVFDGESYSMIDGIGVDDENNVYLSGFFEGTNDFDPGVEELNLTSQGLDDGFALKLNSLGELFWAVSFGGTGYDNAGGCVLDSQGHMIIAGWFQDEVDFDPGIDENIVVAGGDVSGFVLSIDADGDFVAANILSASEDSYIEAVTLSIDDFDNLYITGQFFGTVDFDPSAEVFEMTDDKTTVFIGKINSNGTFVWSWAGDTIGTSSFSGGSFVDVNSLGELLLAGCFTGTIDFEPGTDTEIYEYVGSLEVFQVKLNDCGDDNLNPPVPDLSILPDVQSECEVTELTPPSATDNCTGMVLGTTDVSFPILEQGTTVVTWTYDDGEGNVSTQFQNVVIADTTPPVAENDDLENLLVECEVMSMDPPVAMDDCDGLITGVSDISFPLTDQGTTVVTWSYIDSQGNVSTQEQSITISDETSPVPEIEVLVDVIADCEVTNIEAPMAIDNCDGMIVGVSDVILPISEQGTTVVVWTYTDSSGNTFVQEQVVVISDQIAPEPDLETLEDVYDDCEFTSLDSPTATDNCGGSIEGVADVSLPISEEGATVVTWTFEDDNGNVSTQTQNFIYYPISNEILQLDQDHFSAEEDGYTYQWLDCDDDFSPIEGATNIDFYPPNDFTFAVEVSNGVCSVISDCIYFTNNVEENGFQEEVRVFPNPTATNLSVDLGRFYPEVQIRVFNSIGEEVINRIVYEAGVINLDFQVSQGIYVLEVNTVEGQKAILRVIKE